MVLPVFGWCWGWLVGWLVGVWLGWLVGVCLGRERSEGGGVIACVYGVGWLVGLLVGVGVGWLVIACVVGVGWLIGVCVGRGQWAQCAELATDFFFLKGAQPRTVLALVVRGHGMTSSFSGTKTQKENEPKNETEKKDLSHKPIHIIFWI
jgi:hypothetical protein